MKKRLISCHQIINLLLFSILVMPISLMAQSSDGGLTTFILVRHAEKVDDSRDPDLSEAGYHRAELLAEMFNRVPFDAVYSTDFIRTRETARSIADKNNLEIQFYEYQNASSEVDKWMQKHHGETILISGHSTTTPMVTNAILGEEHFENNFDESDYGNILIITISGDGKKELLHLRY
jgi:broad specificity phosphatase PhoE